MLSFRDVRKVYPGGKTAVQGASFDVPKGQFCVLLGSSGAGKSTLLRMVNGMHLPTSGSVTVDGLAVQRKRLSRVQRRVGMIHQQFFLVPRLSVLDNVLSGTLPAIATWRVMLRWWPVELQRRACRLLAEVELQEEHLYRRAANLSGGEQQRVAIARAFMLSPAVVLADEPVASLDPATSRAIMDLLRSASRRTETTVLCSLHQVDIAREFADRIVAMQAGQIVFDGPPNDLTDTTLHGIYGGVTLDSSANGNARHSDRCGNGSNSQEHPAERAEVPLS